MTDNRPWAEDALCATSPEPDAWYAERPEDIAYAISVCRRCDVRIQCLDAALTNGERAGVWGGVYMSRDGVKTENLAVRVWAAQVGTPLAHLGRLSREVVRDYRQANPVAPQRTSERSDGKRGTIEAAPGRRVNDGGSEGLAPPKALGRTSQT